MKYGDELARLVFLIRWGALKTSIVDRLWLSVAMDVTIPSQAIPKKDFGSGLQ